MEKVYTGEIELLLGGLEGSLTLDSTDTVQFRGLGLGEVTSTVKHGPLIPYWKVAFACGSPTALSRSSVRYTACSR